MSHWLRLPLATQGLRSRIRLESLIPALDEAGQNRFRVILFKVPTPARMPESRFAIDGNAFDTPAVRRLVDLVSCCKWRDLGF